MTLFKASFLSLGLLLGLSPLMGVSAQTVYPSCPTTQTACSRASISALGTTIIKNGPGFLHTVTINTVGATADTLTLYDSTTATGTVIATVDTTTNVATLIFDVGFINGLTAVTASGTSANITISYK